MGVLSAIKPQYSPLAAYFFGIWNITIAVSEFIMHSVFVYIIITRVRRTKNSAKKMIQLSILVGVNSVLLLVGGIWNVFDSQVGTVIIYSSWLADTWCFLLINAAVKKYANSKVDVSNESGSAHTET